jgi:hypothetical protein
MDVGQWHVNFPDTSGINTSWWRKATMFSLPCNLNDLEAVAMLARFKPQSLLD